MNHTNSYSEICDILKNYLSKRGYDKIKIGVQVRDIFIRQQIISDGTTFSQAFNSLSFKKTIVFYLSLLLRKEISNASDGISDYELFHNFRGDDCKKLEKRRKALQAKLYRQRDRLIWNMDLPDTPKKQPITKEDLKKNIELLLLKAKAKAVELRITHL